MHNRVGSSLIKLLDLFPSFISPVLFSFTFMIQPLHCFIDLIDSLLFAGPNVTITTP